MFGRITGGTTDRVVLHADTSTWEVPLTLAAPVSESPIPTLWARHRLRDLEPRHGAPRRGSAQAQRKADRTTAQLVALGQRYGLLSSATSYIAIEERSPTERSTTPAVLRTIPIVVTQGWHGQGSVLGAMGLEFLDAMPVKGRQALAPQATYNASVPYQAMRSDDMQQTLQDTERFGRYGWDRRLPTQEAAAVLRGRRSEERGPAELLGWGTEDRLFALLMTQQADGSFLFSPVLQHWLGPRWPAVKAATEPHTETHFATTLVIALLALEAADRFDEWAPAVAKARQWLAQQTYSIAVEALL